MSDCPDCKRYRDQLAELKQIATADLEGATADLMQKNRLITRLEKRIDELEAGENQKRKEKPEHKQIDTLLKAWRSKCGWKHTAKIDTDSKRYAIAAAALKRHGFDACMEAIEGLGMRQYSGPKGRSSVQYPGSKKVADVEHALGDDVRVGKCREYVLGYHPDQEKPVAQIQMVPETPPEGPSGPRVDMLAEARAKRQERALVDRSPVGAEWCERHGCELMARQMLRSGRVSACCGGGCELVVLADGLGEAA